MLTTLTTVGYGDILPLSPQERLLIILVFVIIINMNFIETFYLFLVIGSCLLCLYNLKCENNYFKFCINVN